MISLPDIEKQTLTGRIRTRRNWFGRIVLQVEVRTDHYSPRPPTQQLPKRRNHHWRDARRSDRIDNTYTIEANHASA